MDGSRHTALVDGRPLRYTVRRSRRARRVKVQVCRREGVVVVLPWRASGRLVPDLVDEWSAWVGRQADKLDVWDGPRVKTYGTGSTVPLLGTPCRVEVVPAPRSARYSRVERHGDELRLHLVPQDVFDPRPVLEKYLRRVAGNDLRTRTAAWSERLGLHPGKVIVGERTTRWGSCSPRGTLSFCWRLVLAPAHVVDAVVAHELCHLQHLDHSPRFYALLDEACPWHREADAWLKEHDEDLIF